jgi:hypothetical protein
MQNLFSRLSLVGLAALQLCGLFFVPGVSEAREKTVEELDSVRMDAVITGIPVIKKVRYQVKDLRMGSLSVRHLFAEIPNHLPAGFRYYSGAKETILVKVLDNLALAELRDSALMRDRVSLEIFLEDNASTPMRVLPESLVEFSRVIRIPIVLDGTLTPCEEISRITYRSIGTEVERRLSGETTTTVDLDPLFSKLLKDEIEPYILSLDPPDRESRCFRDFHLLKWVQNESIDKFGFQSYSLHPGLQSLLRSLAYSLTENAKWEKTRFSIDLIGFTDHVLFGKEKTLPVERRRTGFGATQPSPLDIYYSGCRDDHLSGKAAALLSFGTRSGLPVGPEIENNCELGATRAYVAAAFLKDTLRGRSKVELRYGTGGVFQAGENKVIPNSLGDPSKRRVQVRVMINAAEERPTIFREGDRQSN